MKLMILGATGSTGLQIIRQTIEQGHAVTAFVRSPDRLQWYAGQIAVRQGDLLNRAELEAVLPGHDVVLSAFGPRLPLSRGDADLLRRFSLALTAAMSRTGVRRLVVLSTAFLFRDAIVPPAYLVGRLFFPNAVTDASGMEDVIAGSGLDWTLVRPPQLTDKPFTGKYRVRQGHLPAFGFTVSRADVADFMIRAAADRASIGKVIGVCN